MDQATKDTSERLDRLERMLTESLSLQRRNTHYCSAEGGGEENGGEGYIGGRATRTTSMDVLMSIAGVDGGGTSTGVNDSGDDLINEARALVGAKSFIN